MADATATAAAAAPSVHACTAAVITLGIDVGTTTVCVAQWDVRDTEARVVPTALGKDTTPSYMHCPTPQVRDNVYGEAAVAAGVRGAEHTVSEIKRVFGATMEDASARVEAQRWAVPFTGGLRAGARPAGIVSVDTAHAHVNADGRVTDASLLYLYPHPRAAPLPVNSAADADVHTDADATSAPVPAPVREQRLGEVAYTAADVTALMLRAAVQEAVCSILQATAAEDAGGTAEQPPPIVEAVLTVPAYFTAAQRALMRDVGEAAGLVVLGILSEPTAAALAYLATPSTDAASAPAEAGGDDVMLVFDMGGGTFDVTVLTWEGEDEEVTVLATGGDGRLGGANFDRSLLQYVRAHAAPADPHCTLAYADAVDALPGGRVAQQQHTADALRAVRAAKHRLERDACVEILLHVGDTPFVCRLSRAVAAAVCQPLLDRAMAVVHRVLQDAQMDVAAVRRVLLVGGGTRLPCIGSTLRAAFGEQRVVAGAFTDTLVARGAATQAALLTTATPDVLRGSGLMVHDVLAHSIGVATTGTSMQTIIPRHAPLPATRDVTLVTYVDNQRTATVAVFQGEHADVRSNTCLGRFTLSGLPPAPRGGVQIRVTISASSSGTLTVTAADTTGATRKSLTVDSTSGPAGPPSRDGDETALAVPRPPGSDGDGDSDGGAEGGMSAEARAVEARARRDLWWYAVQAKSRVDAVPDMLLQHAPLPAAQTAPQPSTGGGAASGAAVTPSSAAHAAAVRAAVRMAANAALAYLDTTHTRFDAELRQAEMDRLKSMVEPVTRAMANASKRDAFGISAAAQALQ